MARGSRGQAATVTTTSRASDSAPAVYHAPAEVPARMVHRKALAALGPRCSTRSSGDFSATVTSATSDAWFRLLAVLLPGVLAEVRLRLG